MVTPLDASDRDRITRAVTAAEAGTDCEIVTIIADRSDAYHDVVLHWAVLAMLVTLTIAALRPDLLAVMHRLLNDGWADTPSIAAMLRILPFTVATIFLIVRFTVGHRSLRYRLTPGATLARRVRRRAITLFRVGVQAHTGRGNGVLIYLSTAERRAEIVADAAVHVVVPADAWGDIVADLVAGVADDRTADAMVDAVAAVGGILAAHFPHTGDDPAELPDRVIQL